MRRSPPPRLILASASPRRRALLASLHVTFDVQECPLREPAEWPRHVCPAAWAQALAYYKAHAVADSQPGRWVLGADTVVACAGELLGKPRDAADAAQMLSLQAGRASDVLTGVALVRRGAVLERRIRVEVTRVWMRDDPAEIAAYVAGGDWAGKAGAYGIQDVGDRLVERIEGSFSNVVGLPLELVSRLLTDLP